MQFIVWNPLLPLTSWTGLFHLLYFKFHMIHSLWSMLWIALLVKGPFAWRTCAICWVCVFAYSSPRRRSQCVRCPLSGLLHPSVPSQTGKESSPRTEIHNSRLSHGVSGNHRIDPVLSTMMSVFTKLQPIILRKRQEYFGDSDTRLNDFILSENIFRNCPY